MIKFLEHSSLVFRGEFVERQDEGDRDTPVKSFSVVFLEHVALFKVSPLLSAQPITQTPSRSGMRKDKLSETFMDAFAVHGWIQERAMSVLVSVSYNHSIRLTDF